MILLIKLSENLKNLFSKLSGVKTSTNFGFKSLSFAMLVMIKFGLSNSFVKISVSYL